MLQAATAVLLLIPNARSTTESSPISAIMVRNGLRNGMNGVLIPHGGGDMKIHKKDPDPVALHAIDHRWAPLCSPNDGLKVPPELKPQCRTSRANYWTISSTFYTVVKPHSRTAALFPNRGSRVLECTFSPRSLSNPKIAWNHGRRRFRILQPLLGITPKLYSLAAQQSSCL